MINVKTCGSIFILATLFQRGLAEAIEPLGLRQFEIIGSKEHDSFASSRLSCRDGPDCRPTISNDMPDDVGQFSGKHRAPTYDETVRLIADLRGAGHLEDSAASVDDLLLKLVPRNTYLAVRRTRSEPPPSTNWLGTHAAGTAWDAYVRILRQQHNDQLAHRSSNPVSFIG